MAQRVTDREGVKALEFPRQMGLIGVAKLQRGIGKAAETAVQYTVPQVLIADQLGKLFRGKAGLLVKAALKLALADVQRPRKAFCFEVSAVDQNFIDRILHCGAVSLRAHMTEQKAFRKTDAL